MRIKNLNPAITLLFLIFITIFSANLVVSYAQPPPWPLKIIIDRGEYYLGEDGLVKLNITNYACSSRVDRKTILSWNNEERSVIEPYIKRIEEMILEGKIKNYLLEAENQYVIGDKEYGNYKLSLYGVCVGEPIEIRSIAIWFSWRGFGRALISTVEKKVLLQAFDAANYVVNSNHPESSAIFEIVFPFPSNLPPELVPSGEVVPNIEVTMRLPTGTIWTFDRGFKVSGGLKIIPSRTFKLKVMDNAGETLLPSGLLRIQALTYTYYEREYYFTENSTILIERLPDEYDYLVTVLYESPYTGLEEVYRSIKTSYDLANDGMLKTNLYNLKISPLDHLGRQLVGAEVYLDGIKKLSKDGLTIFPLVPAGNHTLRVNWMGIDVLYKWIWIGYHATLNPSGVVPDLISVATNVGDLVIQVMDAEGLAIDAYISVNGPGVRISDRYVSNGLLILQQLPITNYQVNVRYYSEPTESEVVMSLSIIPSKGETSFIKLPVHKVAIIVYSLDKKPIADALVEIGKLKTMTGINGESNIGALPEGIYTIKISMKGLEIFDESIIIKRSGKIEIITKTSSVRILLKDIEGELQDAYWYLTGPEGVYSGYGSIIELPPVPDEVHGLIITLWPNGSTIIERQFQPSELMNGEVVLPVSKMKIVAKWEDGVPLTEGKIIINSEKYNLSRTLRLMQGSVETSDKLPLTDYKISLYLSSGPQILTEEKEFNGDMIELIVPARSIVVFVNDIFGQDVPEAIIEAYYGSIFIEREITTHDGSAILRRVPTYFLGPILVRATYREMKTEQYISANQNQASLTLNAVKVGIAVIPLDEFVRYIFIIIILISIYPLLLLSKKLSTKKKEKKATISM